MLQFAEVRPSEGKTVLSSTFHHEDVSFPPWLKSSKNNKY